MISVMSNEKEATTTEGGTADSEVKTPESKNLADKKEAEEESTGEAKQQDAASKQEDTSNKQEEDTVSKPVAKTPPKKKATDFKPRRKKPRDAPRRPLSAYNIYFRQERAALIARNDEGNPDEDFQVNLDVVVATGKKRDDPSAVFQAAARTLATRWKKMAPEDKSEYEESAEDEMKRYRARVYEYESRMVEEARQKSSSGVPSDTKISPRKTLDPKTQSRHNEETSKESQGPNLKAGGNINVNPYPQQPQLWTGAPGVPLPGYGPLPTGLGYTLMQPGMQNIASFPPHQFVHQGPAFVGGQPLSNEALMQLMQAQGGGPRFVTYPTPGSFGAFPSQAASSAAYGDWRGQPTFQDPILSALQREHVLQDQLNAARAANAPVAMTILPPGSADHQMLLQLLERDRRSREGGGPSQGAAPHNYPSDNHKD